MQARKFITSYATFYLKGEIKQEGNFVSMKSPNTILTFIPLGYKSYSAPINQISSVETSFKVYIKSVLIGLFVTIIGLGTFEDSLFGGLVLTLVGINMILNSLQTTLNVIMTSGQIYTASFIIFQKSLAEMIASEIRELISNRIDDTNVRTNSDRIIEAINNK